MNRPSDLKPSRAAIAGFLLAALWLACGPWVSAQNRAAPTGNPASAEASIDEIVVRILANAEVAGDLFTLGEVAEFDGFDVEGSASLAKLSLGRSPSPGRPRSRCRSSSPR